MRTEEEIEKVLKSLENGNNTVSIHDSANDILSRIDTCVRIDMLKWVLERD